MFKTMIMTKAICYAVSLLISAYGGTVVTPMDGHGNPSGEGTWVASASVSEMYQMYGAHIYEIVEETDGNLSDMERDLAGIVKSMGRDF